MNLKEDPANAIERIGTLSAMFSLNCDDGVHFIGGVGRVSPFSKNLEQLSLGVPGVSGDANKFMRENADSIKQAAMNVLIQQDAVELQKLLTCNGDDNVGTLRGKVDSLTDEQRQCLNLTKGESDSLFQRDYNYELLLKAIQQSGSSEISSLLSLNKARLPLV